MRLLTITSIILLTGYAQSFCVIDNKHGWWLDCGIRDSYLFKLADWGGLTAKFDVGIGVGDKEGFPYGGGEAYKRSGQAPVEERSDRPAPQKFKRFRVPHPIKGLPPGAKVFRGPPPGLSGRQDHLNTQFIPGPQGQRVPVIIKQVPGPFIEDEFSEPSIPENIAELLKISSDTPADTDHVPSFVAKEMIVREAPVEYFPPNYPQQKFHPHFSPSVKVPRTKFFCEEQKYLPGLYSDQDLGCKVFHLCVPASVGSKMTSFLCPNSTLFDQSILQCNWWFNVECEQSIKHYDANLALSSSYRKINAAHLPLLGSNNLQTLALLSPAQQKRSLTIAKLEKEKAEKTNS